MWGMCLDHAIIFIMQILSILRSPSELRKLHDSITDPKYDGVKTSRRQFQASGDENEEDVYGSESGSYEREGTPPIHRDSLSSALEDEEAYSPMPNGAKKSPTDDEASTRQQGRDSNIVSEQDEALASSLQRTRVADKLKGKAVSRQIVCCISPLRRTTVIDFLYLETLGFACRR
jgi:protein AATF/BFR2